MARRVLFIVIGSLSFILGCLALLIPVLPTSPFIIISAACFLKSSRKLYLMVAEMPYFGNHVKAYIHFRAVSPQARVGFLVFFWGAVLASAIFITRNLWLRIFLGVFAAGVTTYMFSLNALTDEMREKIDSLGVEATP